MKTLRDYLDLVFRSLMHRQLRSWLTIIGILIGVAAVVALVSLGQGFQKAIDDEFAKLGKDRITVMPGGTLFGPLSASLTSAKLTEDDVDAILSVNGVESATGVMFQTATVQFNKEKKELTVVGTATDAKTVKFVEGTGMHVVEKGRQIKSPDVYKADIGPKIANGTFDKQVKIGDTLIIKGYEFEVVGIQKKTGTGTTDEIVRIPRDTLKDIFDKEEEYSTISVKVKSGFDPDAVAEEIIRKLRSERDVEKGKEDFNVQTVGQILETFNSIFLLVQVVIIGIAAISLVVGAIGIMNTMYTAVLERTNEIGVMKAIGAKNHEILILFLIESGFLGMVGGLIGIGLGIAISKTVEYVATQALGSALLKAYFPWYLIVGALMFSFIIGSIAGTVPAVQASKMKPVDSLRYE